MIDGPAEHHREDMEQHQRTRDALDATSKKLEESASKRLRSWPQRCRFGCAAVLQGDEIREAGSRLRTRCASAAPGLRTDTREGHLAAVQATHSTDGTDWAGAVPQEVSTR